MERTITSAGFLLTLIVLCGTMPMLTFAQPCEDPDDCFSKGLDPEGDPLPLTGPPPWQTGPAPWEVGPAPWETGPAAWETGPAPWDVGPVTGDEPAFGYEGEHPQRSEFCVLCEQSDEK